jgi:hypothetical protein
VETSAPRSVWIALAAFASLLALWQTLRIAWTSLSRRWAVQARSRRAIEGELRAEPMLRRAGYEVLERQARTSWTVYADGEPIEVGLRADLIVQRGGRRYVAEVKTGKLAPRLDHAPTRRQLLEYRVAFGVDGVLLVDAEEGRVKVVELGGRDDGGGNGEGAGLTRWIPVFGVGVFVGVAVEWFLRR